MLKCPNCEKELTKTDQSFVCSNHHLFDVSRSGYVNLLLANENKRQTGDNQEMITARIKFMQAGYYHKLEKLLSGVLASLINQNSCSIVDCGCGPGFFTNSLKKTFPKCDVFGVDISKKAIEAASKTYKNIQFIVGNSLRLPFMGNSVDVLINIFAPHFESELKRVLKTDGWLVKVVPNTNHLRQLKERLYEAPLFYEPKKLEQPYWRLIGEVPLTYDEVMTKEPLENLLKMTPYFYTTPSKGLEKLKEVNTMKITMDFLIYIIKRDN